MRRQKALKRGRIVPILLAGSVGYLLGSAHITALRGADVSAAEAVAQRFPQDWKNASLATATAIRAAALKLHTPKSASVASAGAITADTQLALLSPEPMAPRPVRQSASDTTPQADQDIQATLQTASAEELDAAPAPDASVAPQAAPPRAQALSPKPAAAASQPAPAPRLAAVAPHPHINDRPGYILNDMQIASIKERLHLTPGQ